MENNYGETLRSLRISKGMSLENLAEEIVSYSFLSKFERGESDITLSKFIDLLTKLHVDLSEFIYLSSGTLLPFISKIKKIKSLFSKQDIAKLKCLAQNEHSLFKKTKDNYHYCNSIMIEALIHELDHKYHVHRSKSTYIINYLLNNAYWGKYELSLFGNSIGILPVDKILTLSNEIFSRGKKLIKSRHNPRDIIRTIQNISYVLINNGMLTEAHDILGELEDKLMRQDFYFEKSRQLFFKGIIKISSDEVLIGKQECEKAIQVMELSSAESFAELHKKELQMHLNKVNDFY